MVLANSYRPFTHTLWKNLIACITRSSPFPYNFLASASDFLASLHVRGYQICWRTTAPTAEERISYRITLIVEPCLIYRLSIYLSTGITPDQIGPEEPASPERVRKNLPVRKRSGKVRTASGKFRKGRNIQPEALPPGRIQGRNITSPPRPDSPPTTLSLHHVDPADRYST